MKRITALFLVLFVLFASIALADDSDTLLKNDEYSYRILEDGTISLKEYFGSSREVTVPADIDEIPVTELDGTFFCKPIESVVIPEGITVIAENTFCGCTKLISVVLPATLTTVKRAAFGNCQSLTELDMPVSLTTLQEYAFLNCVSLKKICLYASLIEIEDNALYIVPDINDYFKLVLPDECVLYVEEGSVAEEYAKAHEVAYEILIPEAGVEETITAKK